MYVAVNACQESRGPGSGSRHTPVSRGLGEEEEPVKQTEKEWLVKEKEDQENVVLEGPSEERRGRGQWCQMLLRGQGR